MSLDNNNVSRKIATAYNSNNYNNNTNTSCVQQQQQYNLLNFNQTFDGIGISKFDINKKVNGYIEYISNW